MDGAGFRRENFLGRQRSGGTRTLWGLRHGTLPKGHLNPRYMLRLAPANNHPVGPSPDTQYTACRIQSCPVIAARSVVSTPSSTPASELNTPRPRSTSI